MSELIDTELDAVCGGILDFGNTVWQSNNATNTSVNVLSFQGGETEQSISQNNTSLIGSAIFTVPVRL
jgi:hypothetical protein